MKPDSNCIYVHAWGGNCGKSFLPKQKQYYMGSTMLKLTGMQVGKIRNVLL